MSIDQGNFLDTADEQVLENIHALNTLVFHLCERINKADGQGTSLSGIASPEFVARYKDYRSDRVGTAESPKPNHFSSPGFLYDEASVEAMKAAGFPTSPSIATSVGYSAPVYTKQDDGTITAHFNDASPHPLKKIGDYFSSMGVRTFIVSGGHFPNEEKESAIVVDVNDPSFVSKVKEGVLDVFQYEAAEMLSTPNHMHTSNDYLAYSTAILKQLEEYAKQKGVEGLELTKSLGRYDPVVNIANIPEGCSSQAKYQLKWVTGVLDPVLDGIDPAEIGEIILDIAVAFKANATLRKHLLLAHQIDFSPSATE